MTELFRKTLGRFYVAGYTSDVSKAFGIAVSYTAGDLSLDAAFGSFILSAGVQF
jgi:hypothetical protein